MPIVGWVNQALITGESLPVDKGPGDQVFAGSINETVAFEFRVTAATQDTTLARIIHAIENALSARAPTQRFVDEFGRSPEKDMIERLRQQKLADVCAPLVHCLSPLTC